MQLLDTFGFSNTYACTQALAALARSSASQRQRTIEACSRTGAAPPSFECVLKLLSAFQPQPSGDGWRSVLGVCNVYPTLYESVDIRRLVQFAVLNRVLRRVHSFPVAQSRGVSRLHASPAEEWQLGRFGSALTVLDGQRHMDSVCCALEAPCAAAERMLLEVYPDCVWVHR